MIAVVVDTAAADAIVAGATGVAVRVVTDCYCRFRVQNSMRVPSGSCT
jgi:hypothetical protein